MGIKKNLENINQFKNYLSTQYYNGLQNNYDNIVITMPTDDLKTVINDLNSIIISINKIEEVVE